MRDKAIGGESGVSSEVPAVASQQHSAQLPHVRSAPHNAPSVRASTTPTIASTTARILLSRAAIREDSYFILFFVEKSPD